MQCSIRENLVQAILTQPYGAALAEVMTQLEKEQGVKFIAAARGAIVPEVRKKLPCLLIASVQDAKEVPVLVHVLRTLKDDIQSEKMRCLVVMAFPNPGAATLFKHLGCCEVISGSVESNFLRHKIAMHGNYVQNVKPRKQLASGTTTGTVGITGVHGGHKMGKNMWAFSPDPPRFANGKWSVRMSGPKEESGLWVQLEPAQDGSPRWQFKQPENKDGNWYWQGEKPAYEKGFWTFSSEKPELKFTDKSGEEFNAIETRPDGEISLNPIDELAPVSIAESVKVFQKQRRSAKVGKEGLRLPPPVAMAVVLSDFLLSPSGAERIMSVRHFCTFLSSRLPNVVIRLLTLNRSTSGKTGVMLFDGENNANAGTEINLDQRPDYAQITKVIKTGSASRSSDGGAVYAPIKASKTDSKTLPLGILIFESANETEMVPIDPRYAHLVAQSLRGALLSERMQIEKLQSAI